jgi:colanic acid/amylovoran biosynthesis glycosyltransferase
MRIAYLVNQYPAATHTFIRREILALEQLGMDVMRISLRGWDRELVDEKDCSERIRTRYVLRDGASALLLSFVRMLITHPVRVIRTLALVWRMGRRGERPLAIHLVYLAEAARIEPWLRKGGVQHLHAHFGTNSAEVAMLVHALGGPQWSFTAHGPTEFDKAELLGLREKILRCSFVVAISSYGRSQLYRCIENKHWSKVHVVRCGLDSHFFTAPTSPPPQAPRLVCVGRLVEQKGHRLLIEAAHSLAARGTKFKLVIVGDGEMRSVIEELIKRHNLVDKVSLTGTISNSQVRSEILAARALVLASFAEGLPIVIMEAMAVSRPVITTFVAGIPELVRPGEDGWLVPAGDVESLAEAMQACLDASTETLTRMGKAARERVLARHRADTEAAELNLLFHAGAKTAGSARCEITRASTEKGAKTAPPRDNAQPPIP